MPDDYVIFGNYEDKYEIKIFTFLSARKTLDMKSSIQFVNFIGFTCWMKECNDIELKLAS